MHAAVSKESTVEQGEIRRPVNPRLRYQKECYPRSPWTIYVAVHVLQRHMKCSRKSRGNNAKLFWKGGMTMTNTASLCQKLDGLRNRSFSTIKVALQDHSCVATQQERSRNEKSWKLSLNAEAIQGPLNQRSDFKGEANMQKTVSRIYGNHWKWKQTCPSRATSQTTG